MSPTRHAPEVRYLRMDLPRGKGFPRHQHEEHQLLVVERGAMAVGSEADEWAVPPRTGVWLASGLDHQLHTLADAAVVFAYIGPGGGWRAPPTGMVAIRPLLREVLSTLARPDAIRGAPRARLEAVLLDELSELRPEGFQVRLPVDSSARFVAEGLLADPAENRSLDDWGRAAGASPRTLQRRFREETGLTFQRWRRAARVQTAMGWLADGDPVTTVAHRCGFASASAFVAAFRLETGTTPAAWKRQIDQTFGST